MSDRLWPTIPVLPDRSVVQALAVGMQTHGGLHFFEEGRKRSVIAMEDGLAIICDERCFPQSVVKQNEIVAEHGESLTLRVGGTLRERVAVMLLDGGKSGA